MLIRAKNNSERLLLTVPVRFVPHPRLQGNRLAGLAVDQGTIFVASSGSGEVMTVPSDDERDSGGRDLQPYSFTG